MRAVAVFPGTRDSLHVVNDASEPQGAPDLAVVRVLEAGWCGTDVEIHQGHYGTAPPGSPFLILGHENLGVVSSSPAGSALTAGDLVVATVRRPCPQMCAPCAAGENDMCLTGNFLERGISGLHGFMSEVYSESPQYLVKVPHSLRNIAVLMEPMSVVEKGIEHAFKMQERFDWKPRQAVVLGAGPVGILAPAALRLRGLEVTVGSRDVDTCPRAAYLAEAGIRYRSTTTSPLSEWPRAMGPIDLVFEATGAAGIVFPSMRLLGPDGVCILSSVTGVDKPVECDISGWNRDMVLGNQVVFGTVNAGRRHFEMGARDLQEADERVPGWLGRMITRRIPFTDVHQALKRSQGDIKTVLRFD
jgi:glucose 1-dehydrogenase